MVRGKTYSTRCHVRNKACSLIINCDNCTNVATTKFLRKLNFHTTKHPIFYKLSRLNDDCEVKVNKQVLNVISIGKYCDDMLCDVMLM
jgi:hypothetical protein